MAEARTPSTSTPMPRREREEPSEWSVREAVERYLNRRQADATDESIRTWRYRLKLFREWCEGVGIEVVGELTAYDLDEYFDTRSASIAPATLMGEMWTLRMMLRYLDQVGAVDDDLAEAVRIPDLDEEDEVSDIVLEIDLAKALIDHHRHAPTFGSRDHVLLELAWVTGARRGGLRALDVRDFTPEDLAVEFHHRPGSGTPLKNKRSGERPVGIPPKTVEALERYLDHHRPEVRDDHDRQPLIASQRGRPTRDTITSWMYLATQPCIHGPCPHGKDPETCSFRQIGDGSKCPSSRSPHPVRSGSITWQLNLGLPPAVVAERVNADIDTIESHYDFASDRERWRRFWDHLDRRREHLSPLEDDL